MGDIEEISLTVDGQVFKVKKNLLCEYSDYFRAMFSGSYIEKEQQEINIDLIDATSMNIILRYMELGLIDLSDYTLSTIGELAVAANFLQITELMKQLEYCLDLQLSLSNWMEIMAIAENSSYTKLEKLCAAFGLLSFKSMKPEYIPTVHKLFWYLSHPYLDAACEFDVFKFGLHWILNTETGPDALMIILGCLDIKRLTDHDLKEIKMALKDYVNSLAAKVVDCLYELLQTNIGLSSTEIAKQKNVICEKYTDRVYYEVLNLTAENLCRQLVLTPVVPVWSVLNTKLELVPHNMYIFNKKTGFEKWLEVADKNLWGWSVTSWGANKLVIVCGEHGRGTGIFMKDVKVYDTLRQEWTRHGVSFPSRRHGGVAVVEDSLFIVGGVGGFRVILDSAIIYDLKQRTYRKIANFTDAIQNPAMCAHSNKIYASGQKNIYRYDDLGDSDRWMTVAATDTRIKSMTSFKNYIYCTQNFFSHIYRFRPDVDVKLELITYLSNPPAAVCDIGDRLMIFTRTVCGETDVSAVEEYNGETDDAPNIVWSELDSNIKVNDVAGACALVMNLPPLKTTVSQYHKRHLTRYPE